MTMPNRKGWLAILFIILTLAIPFALVYYTSTPAYKERFKGWRERNAAAGLPSRSKVTQEQVLLLKDEKVIIDRICVVFKGLTNRNINLDLYLLDLDPEIPYPLSFSKKAVDKGIWLENTMFSLLSAKENTLRLKIEDQFSTQ